VIERATIGRWLAYLLTAASGALTSGALVFLALSRDARLPDAWGFRGESIIHALGFTAVGAVVALRRPANAIGWLLLSAGLISALGALALEYGVFAIVDRTVMLPGGLFSAWLGSWIWVLYIVGIFPFVLLLFPNGRLLSARWWLVGCAAILEVAMTATLMAFRPGPLQLAAYVDNPFTPLASSLVDTLGRLTPWLSLLMIGGAAWSVALRFRRATGIERQQIKWVAFSAGPLGAAAFASIVLPDKLGQVLFVFMLLSVPVAIGIAVLRYRLYDIDLVIERTLVYGVVSATLGATYVAAVVVLQGLLRPITSGSEFAVALSTLLVVALFNPIRSRAQDVVDRRFYRARYDAARTIDAFSVRLRGDVDLDSVRADLIGVVHDTIHPAHASVWLRGASR
jgi:hypothetical protein